MTRLFIALKTLFLLLTLTASAKASELRLVTLTPALTESVQAFGRGDWIVGTDQASDAGLAIVGDYQRINVEAILALNPTHVLSWEDSTPPDLAEKLKAFGISLWISKTRTLDQIADGMAELGRLLNVPDDRAQSFAADIQALSSEYRGKRRLTTAWLLWDRPLMVVAGRGYQADALRLCGADNPYEALPMAAATVSPESLVESGAELLIASDPAWLGDYSAWKNLTAVQQKQWFTPNSDTLSKPGMGLVSGIRSLCDAIDRVRTRL